MSTQINVSVALESLRRLSQAQINANRQSKLLEDQRLKLAQQSVDTQAQSEATQGRDVRGQLLYGIKSDRQRPQPQPFAVYRPGSVFAPGWLLVPSDAGFTAVVRNLLPFAFYQITPPYWGSDYHAMRFASGEGPLSSNAFYSSETPLSTTPDSSFYSAAMYANSKLRLEPTSTAFTLEMLAKLPAPITNQDTLPFSYSYANIAFGQVALSVEQSQSNMGGGLFQPFNHVSFYWGYGRRKRVWDQDNPQVGAGDAVAPDSIASSVWHHIALVQTPGSTDDLRSVACYVGGVRYFYLQDLPAGDVDWAIGGEDDDDLSLENAYGNGTTAPGSIADIPTLIHGIRFTPRALYTGASFTPPTSITSLA